METVLITEETAERPSGRDVLVSWHPGHEGLTYYYWDDWALCGLLFPGGSTLTLGLGGGAGPWRLRHVDPAHAQHAVDLDLSLAPALPPRLTAERGDALRHGRELQRDYDVVWVDLYDEGGRLVRGIFEPEFLTSLARRSKLVLINVFRPENRFYRFERRDDPFEPLLAAHLRALGLRARLFDRYAGQTWAVSAEPFPLRERLEEAWARPLERRWLDSYMLRVLREPAAAPRLSTPEALEQALRAAVAASALAACGVAGAASWDAVSDDPEAVLASGARARLIYETLAVWSTSPLPPLPEAVLRRLEARREDWPELELRRR